MIRRKVMKGSKIIEKNQIKSRTGKRKKGQGQKIKSNEITTENKPMDSIEEIESGDSGQEGQNNARNKVSEIDTNSETKSTNSADISKSRIDSERKKTEGNNVNKGNRIDSFKNMIRIKGYLDI